MPEREVIIDASGVLLPGNLNRPDRATGLVVFAHGSGSSRHSSRNRQVASHLNRAGIATLLFDLLTPEEAVDRRNVFAIPLLAERVREAVGWRSADPELARLPLGLFGASTGSAAALFAAAELGREVGAVVSRGGRPDLAASRLGEVTSPTLLIIGGADTQVLELNEQAAKKIQDVEVAIVPSAGHLFEEPGALERASELAAEWFTQRISG